ncbi:SLATT domain-containing protein [Persicobacter sp. CCB-QB2]|uniref:SLATT domain-containing protein n=1 Tax=Persicobacter sp. CCB-QB2 TaxID=1561025 RepID=UPI0006A9AEAD|nr:SLATT domain-containing protein [Persicobacter sp. CCB-QB2]
MISFLWELVKLLARGIQWCWNYFFNKSLEDSEEVVAGLQEEEVLVFNNALEFNKKTIDWYSNSIRFNRPWAIAIRRAMLEFFCYGVLLPLLVNMEEVKVMLPGVVQENAIALGYISFVLAGFFKLWDNLNNFSSSWFRFTQTKMALEQLRDQYLNDINKYALAPKGNSDLSFIQLTEKFYKDSHALIIEETNVWIKEYQQQLSKLEGIVAEKTV